MLEKLDIVLSIIGGVAILGTIGLGIVVLYINRPEKFNRAFWIRRLVNLIGMTIGFGVLKFERLMCTWAIDTEHIWVFVAVNTVLTAAVIVLVYYGIIVNRDDRSN